MFEIIGSFIDNLIFIGGGVFLLSQRKKINKSYVNWIGVVMIVMAILLTVMDIMKLIN